jgi:hypothetical protein
VSWVRKRIGSPAWWFFTRVHRRLDLERVSPVGAVLGLDPAAPAGEVVAAALLGDNALEAEVADLVPECFAVGVARRGRPVTSNQDHPRWTQDGCGLAGLDVGNLRGECGRYAARR